jgi:hypothetical protein
MEAFNDIIGPIANAVRNRDRLTKEQKFLVFTTFYPVLGMGVIALIFIARMILGESI